MRPKYPQKQHRSGLEDAFRTLCEEKGLEVKYENSVLPYVTDPQKKRYIPDWEVTSNIFIETKGRFTAADRKKALYIQDQHPEAVVLYVFQRPNNTLSKASKTTYGDWCDKHNLPWCSFSDVDYWTDFIRKHQRMGVGLRPKAVRKVSK